MPRMESDMSADVDLELQQPDGEGGLADDGNGDGGSGGGGDGDGPSDAVQAVQQEDGRGSIEEVVVVAEGTTEEDTTEDAFTEAEGGDHHESHAENQEPMVLHTHTATEELLRRRAGAEVELD